MGFALIGSSVRDGFPVCIVRRQSINKRGNSTYLHELLRAQILTRGDLNAPITRSEGAVPRIEDTGLGGCETVVLGRRRA